MNRQEIEAIRAPSGKGSIVRYLCDELLSFADRIEKALPTEEMLVLASKNSAVQDEGDDDREYWELQRAFVAGGEFVCALVREKCSS